MQKVSSYDILKGNAHLSHARDYTTYNFNFQVFVRYFSLFLCCFKQYAQSNSATHFAKDFKTVLPTRFISIHILLNAVRTWYGLHRSVT